MKNLSNERLATIAGLSSYGGIPLPPSHDECAAMARELLALREAGKEPVGKFIHWDSGDDETGPEMEWVESTMPGEIPQNAAPQLPAVPMQLLEIDAHGTLRFKQNAIVRKLLDHSTAHGYGLNEMALDDYSADDRMQLAQLIGYSLSGYGTLSYVTDESYDRAIAAAPKPEPAVKK